jgi:hypothetical protein
MAMMRMRMQITRKNPHKSMMVQPRIWRPDLGTSDVNRYEGEDGDNADADKEEEALQADD